MMDQLNLAENVNTLFQSLENFTQKEGVIGKPVMQSQKTFLPVVSVTVGYGSGNAAMKGQTPASGMYQGNASSGTGALGLGAKLNTEAIIVIDDNNQQVTVLPMSGSGAGAGQIMDKIPQILSGMTQNKQASQQQPQQGQPTTTPSV